LTSTLNLGAILNFHVWKYWFNLKSIRTKKKLQHLKKLIKKKSLFWFIRHSKLLEKKLFHKKDKKRIFSQKLQQKSYFWRMIIFEILIRKKCFRRYIGFIRHFQCLSFKTFFLYFFLCQSLQENVKILSFTFMTISVVDIIMTKD
jgi:hypothetical protein